MKLFDGIFKTTTLDKIKKGFDFLIKDFGFKLLTADQVNNLRADYFLVYRNDNSEKQIEICADESWFHSEIRRLIDGNPANYNDTENCISFEDLAIWENEKNYDHFDYFAGGQNGLEGVIENTAKLFRRNQKLLTTNIWLDTEKVRKFEDNEFEEKFGNLPDRSKPTFFENLRRELRELLADKDFEFILDSGKLSPFDRNSITDKLILVTKDLKLEIRQKDWRDDYFIYEVFKNHNKVFAIDISEMDIDRAVDLTINNVKVNI